MNDEPETKFVKLKLTGEIVEVENYNADSTEATIKFLGSTLILRRDEFSHLTAEEMKRHQGQLGR